MMRMTLLKLGLIESFEIQLRINSKGVWSKGFSLRLKELIETGYNNNLLP